MATFLTYQESTMCEQFCHGYCLATNGPCRPDGGRFPGCGAYYVSLPTSGMEMTLVAKKLARALGVQEDQMFDSIQEAIHG